MRNWNASLWFVVGVVLISSSSVLSGTVLFSDDFESGLGEWVKGCGVIKTDPLDSTNNVLSFGSVGYGGDIFSNTISLVVGQKYTLTFDYLGLPVEGVSVADDLGAFLWLSGYENLVYCSTQITYPGTTTHLIDDGQWHAYRCTFVATADTAINIVMEDWGGSGGVAGDVYFDNIRLVPEPCSMVLLGLGGLAALRNRKA